jgi:hypothetical protein
LQNADDSENKLGRSQCVLIESESGVDSRAEVRFCRFDVGERQSGLILHDIKHAFVEDNVIVPVPRNWNWVYDDNLPTPFLIEAMPSKAAKAAPNAAPDVLLRSPIAITKESWTKAISLMPPDEVNNVGEADRLRRVTRRLLEDQAFRANPDLHEFIWWINGVTDIFFGIGATGSVTQELQILGNRIENAMQAIMCDSDDWDRIVIARNFIVMLEGTDNQNYHAIVTSKVRSQIIERNRIRGTKMQGVATGIEAIPESEFIMIRENHIEALTWGIKFDVPTDAAGASSVPPGVQWMIVDNLTRGGSNDLPSSSPGLRVTNNIQS